VMAFSREHPQTSRDLSGEEYPPFRAFSKTRVFNIATPVDSDEDEQMRAATDAQDRIRAQQRPDLSHWDGTHAGHNRSAATASSSADRSQSVRPECRNSMEPRWSTERDTEVSRQKALRKAARREEEEARQAAANAEHREVNLSWTKDFMAAKREEYRAEAHGYTQTAGPPKAPSQGVSSTSSCKEQFSSAC
jgi:hypothetical protein